MSTTITQTAAFKHTAAESLPLSVRSTLLKPEAERAELFALPTQEQTAEEHRVSGTKRERLEDASQSIQF